MEPLTPLLEEYFKLEIDINDEKTRYLCRLALKNFGQAIDRSSPCVNDLTNDNFARMARWCLDRKLAATTINERRGRVAKFWEFLARRAIVAEWPLRRKIPEPVRTPIAWLRPELKRIFDAVRSLRGEICGVPKAKWWRALLLVDWDTGERIGALLAFRWTFLSGEWLHVPAEVRKGKRKDILYKLAPDTLEALSEIRRPNREAIFPWPYDANYIFNRYDQILERAGLPTDRKSKFHRIRRSHASHFEAEGGNATPLLGHTDRRTTVESYLDPRIVKRPQGVDLLFRPEAG